MLTSILFLVASLVVITFIIIKIINPDESKTLSKEEILNRFNPEKEWNVGAFLLKLGPVIAGFGLVGWIATEWWDQPIIRLLLAAVFTLAMYLVGLILYAFNKNNKTQLVFGEASLLAASFLLGGTLYSANDLVLTATGYPLLGIAEMFGIWFLVNVLVAYLAKSTWTFGVNVFVALFWLAGYLNPSFNFAPIFGITNGTTFLSDNGFLSLAIPVATLSITACMYAWHQKHNHNQANSGWRAFYYLSGLFSYLIVGALVFRSIHLYNSNFESFGPNGQILADLLIMVITLLTFAIDYVLKKTVAGYNVNYFVAAVIPIAGLLSFIAFPSAIFTGFFFIEVPFVIWILADYIRQNSPLAGPIFYAFNSIQLFALAANTDSFNWFKILVILSILVYAAMVHYLNRTLIYYTMIAGVLTLAIKIFATGANGFLVIVLIGVVLMAFGVFYTQTRSKMLKHKEGLKSNLQI